MAPSKPDLAPNSAQVWVCFWFAHKYSSYCGLHGANGGGLACVGMELVLLLQELQQEQTKTQLLSPLPFPTTLPLLSACIAQQKTVVIDPVHHLQTLSHDMLHRLHTHTALPVPGSANYSSIFLVR